VVGGDDKAWAHDLWHARRRIADELTSIKTAKVA
jgi:hypothetical protein